MNDLIYSCTEDLPQPSTPACATDYGERIRTIILSKAIVSCSGDVPTASEFAEAFAQESITLITGIVAGHRIKLGDTEIEWHHKEYHDPEYRVEGKIVRFDEAIVRLCERLHRYPGLYLYYITDKNYCFGPYDTSTNFSSILFNGKGGRVGIEFQLDYVGGGADHSNYDSLYDNIINIVNLTVDSTTVTVDSTTITTDMI
jgi:hypothetical protein